MGGFMGACIIWFVGLVTIPIIVSVCDAVAPQFIAIGWEVSMVNLTIYGLKFGWPLLWLIMGIVVFTNRGTDPNE
jgi:hypothetical protein